MKPYEGMPAYEAGIKEGKKQVISYLKDFYCPVILSMLELIAESSNDSLITEITNDCYNYVKGQNFEKI